MGPGEWHFLKRNDGIYLNRKVAEVAKKTQRLDGFVGCSEQTGEECEELERSPKEVAFDLGNCSAARSTYC